MLSFGLGNCERPRKKVSLKKEIWVPFRVPLFLGKWYGVATYFFFIQKIRKTKYIQIHDWIVLFIDWIKEITYLLVLVTIYQKYMAFVLVTFYPKNKIKTRLDRLKQWPKSEGWLRNGKVLGTHSTQTESGLLDSCDQCTSLCMSWMICWTCE